VIDQAGHPHAVRHVHGGWAPVRMVGVVSVFPELPGQPGCPIQLLPERDGTVSVGYRTRTSVDRAGRVHATIVGAEVRVLTDGGRTVLTAVPLPGSPAGGAVDITPDGAHALAVLQHGPVLWWEAKSGRWRQEPLHFEATDGRHVRLSPSGTQALLIDAFGRIELRTLGGGRTAWLTSGPATDAVFGGDDTVFAVDADARIWRWDLADQRAGIAAIHYPHLHHDPTVWAVASTAEVMASGSEGGTVMVVDRRHGNARFQIATAADIYTVVLDADHLVAGGNDGLRMWRWPEGAPIPLADGRGLRAWVVKPATARNGTRVYLVATQRDARIYLWRGGTRTLIFDAGTPGSQVLDLVVAADGRTAAASTSGGRFVLIDVAAERVTAELPVPLGVWGHRVAIDPATAAVVTAGADGYLRAWSVVDGAPRWSVRIGSAGLLGMDALAGRAVTGSRDGSVALIDLATGQIVRRFRGHQAVVLTARFRGDGTWFVTGDENGRACLWRIDEDECHTWLDGHTRGVVTATFAEDGTIFTGSKDGTVRFWRPTYDAPVEALRAELARYGSSVSAAREAPHGGDPVRTRTGE
jgi:WD40 repeat protein